MKTPRWQIWAELLATVAVIQAALWSFDLRPVVAWTLGPILIVGILIRRHYSLNEAGLCWPKAPGLGLALAGTYGLVVLVWISGICIGSASTSQFPGIFPRHTLSYAPWGALQEVIVQLVFGLGLVRAGLSKKNAVLGTALAFALCHAPNPPLMAVTFLGGLLTTWHFLKYRNLWVVALGHAIVGLAIASYWPHKLIVVGIGFVRRYGSPF